MSNEKYHDAVSYLQNASRFRVNPSLESIRGFLKETGLSARPYRAVQVVGTNGKGSTAVFAAYLLAKAGMKTGLYVSPHVFHYGERISINGKSLTSKEFADRLLDFLSDYEDKIEKWSLTEFEILTALAHKIFIEESVDCAVLEAGLGGRFDATTALGCNSGILTSLALDHVEILGDTIEKIGREKLTQLSGKWVNIPEGVSSDTLQVIFSLFEELNVKLAKRRFLIGEITLGLDDSRTGTFFQVVTKSGKVHKFKIPLIGRAYAKNFVTALNGVSTFLSEFSDEEVISEKFLASMEDYNDLYIPARFEVVKKEDVTFIVDGAHNPQAVTEVVQTVNEALPFSRNKFAVVFSFLKDKDGVEMVERVKAVAEEVVVVPIVSGGSRGFEDSEMREFAQNNLVRYESSLEEGLKVAAEASGDTRVLVIGSIYLAGEALLVLKNAFQRKTDCIHYFSN